MNQEDKNIFRIRKHYSYSLKLNHVCYEIMSKMITLGTNVAQNTFTYETYLAEDELYNLYKNILTQLNNNLTFDIVSFLLKKRSYDWIYQSHRTYNDQKKDVYIPVCNNEVILNGFEYIFLLKKSVGAYQTILTKKNNSWILLEEMEL